MNIKQKAALENIKKANAANAARRNFGIWTCAQCGKTADATVHQRRQTYCSKLCMALAYGQRMLGRDNPNYRNAGSRICCECKRGFFSYQPRRKFCSLFCRDNSRGEYHMRMSSKKDANHWEIVRLLMAGGAFVRDTSRAFFGVPDLLVWYKGIWSFIEVKNPETYYGRKGLNKQQRKWAEDWQGGPVFIIRTSEDVARFLAWELDKIDQVGGSDGWEKIAARAAKRKPSSKPKIYAVRNVAEALAVVGLCKTRAA